MKRVRIAVTGVGLVTPLGLGRAATWQNFLDGRRGVRWLSGAEACNVPLPAASVNSSRRKRPASAANKHSLPTLAASATSQALESSFRQFRYFGAPVVGDWASGRRLDEMALSAAREAIDHAGLGRDQLRFAGCVIGTSKLDLRPLDADRQSEGKLSEHPLTANDLFPSSPAAAVARELRLRGAALCPVAACATGLVSIIRGAELIREGICSTVLAGSVDASLHPALLACYKRLGVLARPGDDPQRACRPFDRSRTGFAVGEGAGMLVLEDWEQAESRGAVPLAEWVGGRIGSDPSGLTMVDATGESLARLIEKLLDEYGIQPGSIDLINVHGTATKLNDLAEARALQQVFGPSADEKLCFGLKGAIGHLMGAAGAVETAACVLALQEQIVPPTVNHDSPDAECRLRFCTAPRHARIDHVLKISLGFGGHAAVGLLRRAALDERVV